MRSCVFVSVCLCDCLSLPGGEGRVIAGWGQSICVCVCSHGQGGGKFELVGRVRVCLCVLPCVSGMDANMWGGMTCMCWWRGVECASLCAFLSEREGKHVGRRISLCWWREGQMCVCASVCERQPKKHVGCEEVDVQVEQDLSVYLPAFIRERFKGVGWMKVNLSVQIDCVLVCALNVWGGSQHMGRGKVKKSVGEVGWFDYVPVCAFLCGKK